MVSATSYFSPHNTTITPTPFSSYKVLVKTLSRYYLLNFLTVKTTLIKSISFLFLYNYTNITAS